MQTMKHFFSGAGVLFLSMIISFSGCKKIVIQIQIYPLLRRQSQNTMLKAAVFIKEC